MITIASILFALFIIFLILFSITMINDILMQREDANYAVPVLLIGTAAGGTLYCILSSIIDKLV